MRPIRNTVFADNFPPGEDLGIFLLDPPESETVFEMAFGPKVKSYFDFPDDHWVVASEKTQVGQWAEAYNADTLEPVASELKQTVDWAPDEDVYYFAKKRIVFKSSWAVFVSHWDAFLACEDDGTILMRDPADKEAILFYSGGQIIHIVR